MLKISAITYRQKMPTKNADKDGATVREDTPILIGTIGMLL